MYSFSQDRIYGCRDAMLAALGLPEMMPHPMSQEFLANPLSSLAAFYGAAHDPHKTKDRRAVVALGLSTPDFAITVAETAQVFTRKRFIQAAAHRAFCHVMTVPDFKPVAIADFAISTQLERIGEQGKVKASKIRTTDGGMAALYSYAAKLMFSRQTVFNDELQGVANVLSAYGATAARTEAKLVYDLLESNPIMGDASPMFHADFGNLVQEALSADALGNAMLALRQGASLLRDDGDLADLTAAHLVVSADLEFSAHALNKLIDNRLQVTATAHLQAGRWYLLPAVTVQPVVGVLQLPGTREPVRIEQGQTADTFRNDGFGMAAAADLGVVALSRFAVKGGL